MFRMKKLLLIVSLCKPLLILNIALLKPGEKRVYDVTNSVRYLGPNLTTVYIHL